MLKSVTFCEQEGYTCILRGDMANVTKEALFWTPERKEAGKTQNNLEKDCGKGAVASSSVLDWAQKAAQDQSYWVITVEALCIA